VAAPTAELTATEPSAGSEPGSGMGHAWRALRHRNFRLFFGGQTVSLIGTWMTRVATSWLVYRLTGSALLLGTISFAGQIPTFIFAPLAGVWVDRLDRRKVLVWTQALSMVQSLALAGLTLSHHITIPILLGLSVMQGIVNAFDMPGRQSFMVQMVEDRRDLSNGIAINSSMVNMARLVGPSLAGMLIAVSSEGWCFLVDGISYIAVIASLLMMRVSGAPVKRKTTSMVEELKGGWTYVSEFLPIRTILLLFGVVSLLGMPFVVLMPIFAAQVLHGGPHTLGFLMGAMGGVDFRAGAGGAEERAGAGKDDSDGGGGVWGGADRVWIVAGVLAVDGDGADCGYGLYAGDGGEQYGDSDAGSGRQARAGDELLHDGVYGYGAVWEFAGGDDGGGDWGSVDGDCEWGGVAGGGGVVLVAAAGGTKGDSADI